MRAVFSPTLRSLASSYNEHLEPPPGDELRYLVRDECALLLDGYFRRLARQEAERLLERAEAEWQDQPTRCSRATAGAARCLPARRAAIFTITICSSAPVAAETRAPTASPSVPGTTCGAFTRGACGRGARRPTT